MEKKNNKTEVDLDSQSPTTTNSSSDRKGGIDQGRSRVAIAMSGGVDSSVAAALLKEQGYEVVGFMMKLWSDLTCPASCPRENACCDEKGVRDAREVAKTLGIPFYLVDAREVFRREIVDYFINEYKQLRTPNPCVKCNEKIKFGWLLDFARKAGCDFLATGHYARVTCESKVQKKLEDKIDLRSQTPVRNDNIFHLLKGKDEKKDQSYFLYGLTQEQLSKVIFPIGNYTKDEVRKMAMERNLPVHEKKESQEICFIQDKDYREFLKRNLSAEYFKSGQIVDLKGNVLGRHDGLINYTIGQRKGIDQIQGPSEKGHDKQPMYVVGFDQAKNQLIVGDDREVYKKEMIVGGVHLIKNSAININKMTDLKVKIRYRSVAVNCRAEQVQHERIKVKFNESQRAITPGQSAVFSAGDEVIGGGTIA